VTARDRGSAAILTVVVALAVTATVAVGLESLGTRLADREQARTAADAAALAGVRGGRPASSTLAERNGGVLVSWSTDGTAVTVTVRVGDETAIARATDGP
jgi:2-keto-4-pentenoate hydratase